MAWQLAVQRGPLFLMARLHLAYGEREGVGFGFSHIISFYTT
jgi:hypothetical protein